MPSGYDIIATFKSQNTLSEIYVFIYTVSLYLKSVPFLFEWREGIIQVVKSFLFRQTIYFYFTFYQTRVNHVICL